MKSSNYILILIFALVLLFCPKVVIAKSIVINNQCYEIINDNGAKYCGPYNERLASGYSAIPGRISCDNHHYWVTSVGNESFFQCGYDSVFMGNRISELGRDLFVYSDVGSLVLSDSINQLDSNTFDHTTKLKVVDIPANCTYLSTYTFYEHTPDTIICRSEIPPVATDLSFPYSINQEPEPDSCGNVSLYVPPTCFNFEHCILKVPDPEPYRSAEGWKRFKNIIPLTLTETTFREGIFKYRYTSDSTVCLVSITPLNTPAKVEVSEFIEHNGRRLHVTGIGDRAFYDAEPMTDLVLPASIQRVGRTVWNTCTDLQSITIKATEPPVADGDRNLLPADMAENCVFFVPEGYAEAYSMAYGWSEFANIIQFMESAGENTIIQNGLEFTNDGSGGLTLIGIAHEQIFLSSHDNDNAIDLPAEFHIDGISRPLT